MEEKNLISVIVPVYKVDEKYLRKSIESIIQQSYSYLEIILVDDGSPDQSGTICDSYAKRDKRIKVIHKSNGGVSSARNCGLEKIHGDYVMFVDSDDTLEVDAVKILHDVALRTKADISICSCHHVVEGKIRWEKSLLPATKTVTTGESVKYLAYNTNVFDELEPTAVWGKLYKQAVIRNIRFNEKMTIGEDFVFNYYACCNADLITYSSQKLYNYRIIETSVMHNKGYSPNLMSSFLVLKRFLEEHNRSAYIDDLIARSVNIAFTIYLKVPTTQISECKEIEKFIKTNRKIVIGNRKISAKLKVALVLSAVNFKLMRRVFEYVNKP